MPDAYGNTPLLLACRNITLNAVATERTALCLLNFGADMSACCHGRSRMVRCVVYACASVCARG